MIVRGRDEPYSRVYTSGDRVVVRIDFALAPAAWAEISISKEEIAQLNAALYNNVTMQLKDSEAVITPEVS